MTLVNDDLVNEKHHFNRSLNISIDIIKYTYSLIFNIFFVVLCFKINSLNHYFDNQRLDCS